MRNISNQRLAGWRQILTTAAFGIVALGLSELATSAKPDKPRGKTENVSGSITINTHNAGPGLVGDGYSSPYVDWQELGSPDCVRVNVPSSDGVDQGRVTMFHRGPFDECDDSQRDDRYFSVVMTDPVYNFNDDLIGVEEREEGLRGQFRCWDIFAADRSGAYCRFLIMNDVGDVLWNIHWPAVTVSGTGNVLSVQNSGNAEVFKATEVVKGNGGKTRTELVLQDDHSIPLEFTVERL